MVLFYYLTGIGSSQVIFVTQYLQNTLCYLQGKTKSIKSETCYNPQRIKIKASAVGKLRLCFLFCRECFSFVESKAITNNKSQGKQDADYLFALLRDGCR